MNYETTGFLARTFNPIITFIPDTEWRNRLTYRCTLSTLAYRDWLCVRIISGNTNCSEEVVKPFFWKKIRTADHVVFSYKEWMGSVVLKSRECIFTTWPSIWTKVNYIHLKRCQICLKKTLLEKINFKISLFSL